MNRRSFIAKALAGLAAIPLIGRLVSALPAPLEIQPDENGWYWTTLSPNEARSEVVYVGGRVYVYVNHPSGEPWTEANLNTAEFAVSLP